MHLKDTSKLHIGGKFFNYRVKSKDHWKKKYVKTLYKKITWSFQTMVSNL